MPKNGLELYEEVDQKVWSHLRRVEYVRGFGEAWDSAMEKFRNGVVRYWEVPVKVSWSVGAGMETVEVWIPCDCSKVARRDIAAALTGFQLALSLR